MWSCDIATFLNQSTASVMVVFNVARKSSVLLGPKSAMEGTSRDRETPAKAMMK
jgi:hypothetical protein